MTTSLFRGSLNISGSAELELLKNMKILYGEDINIDIVQKIIDYRGYVPFQILNEYDWVVETDNFEKGKDYGYGIYYSSGKLIKIFGIVLDDDGVVKKFVLNKEVTPIVLFVEKMMEAYANYSIYLQLDNMQESGNIDIEYIMKFLDEERKKDPLAKTFEHNDEYRLFMYEKDIAQKLFNEFMKTIS